jgi:prolyl-tRNA editing enzyme YbaK/EbsC (Cys-tRNA(Pro) deacylase)
MNDGQLPKENLNLSPAEQNRLRQLRQALDQARVQYQIICHADAIDSPEQGVTHGFGRLAEMAPAFLLQSNRGWLCAIISGESRLVYKKIRKQLGLKDVALAKPDVVQQVTGATVGTVSLINPDIPTIIDQHLTDLETVYGGCGVPRHTLQVRVSDLIAVTHAQVFDFAVLKDAEVAA